MPEWLLAFCVNTCLVAGTIISLAIILFLIVIASVELYDWVVGMFTEGSPDHPDTDNEDPRYY